jgi:hypothetical protein
LHGRVLQQLLGQRLLALGHGGKRDGLVGLGGGRNGARVLLGKKPLGTTKYSSTVTASVARNTSQVRGVSSTQSSSGRSGDDPSKKGHARPCAQARAARLASASAGGAAAARTAWA